MYLPACSKKFPKRESPAAELIDDHPTLIKSGLDKKHRLVACNKHPRILKEIHNALGLSSRMKNGLAHQIFPSLAAGLRILMLCSQIMGFYTFYSIMYMPSFKAEKIIFALQCTSVGNSTVLRFPKPNLDAVTWRHDDLTFELGSVVIPVLTYTLKALQNPHDRIAYTSH